MSLRCIDECERYAAEHIKECSAAVLLYEIEGKVVCPTFALLVVMCLDWISPGVALPQTCALVKRCALKELSK
jgi:hypothetical protein